MSTFVRGGGGAGEKVKIDGVKVANKMELTSYKGANPLTIGQAGVAFPANTLFLEDFDIINGVNGEDLTDTAAAQGVAVTELLKMVSRKVADHKGEGEYVWKKTTLETVELTNPTIYIKGAAGTGAAVTCEVADLALVDESFFDGFTYNGRYFFYDESGLHYYNGSSNYDAVWDKDARTITLINNTASFSGTTFTYTGAKAAYRMTNEETLVVSISADGYPNGGVLDGCWYELAKIENAVEVGTITLASATSPVEIPHSLKGVPTKALLVYQTDSSVLATNVFLALYGQTKGIQGSICGFYIGKASGNTSSTFTDIANFIDFAEDKVTFYPYKDKDTYDFHKGTYFWMVAL